MAPGNTTPTDRTGSTSVEYTIVAGPRSIAGISETDITRRSQIVRLRLPPTLLSLFPHGRPTVTTTGTTNYVTIGTEFTIRTAIPLYQTVTVRATRPFTTQQDIISEISTRHLEFVDTVAEDSNTLTDMVHDHFRAGQRLIFARADVERRAAQVNEQENGMVVREHQVTERESAVGEREKAVNEKERALNKRTEELQFAWEEVEAIIKEANEKGVSLQSAQTLQRMVRAQEE